MVRKRVGSALRAIALILSLANGSRAGAAEGEEAGKAEYEKALRLTRAGEHRAALPHFEKAYELSNHRPSTIFSLAQCERALSMYDEAIAHFREYLAAGVSPETADRIQETIKMLEELREESIKSKSKTDEIERPGSGLRTETATRAEGRPEGAETSAQLPRAPAPSPADQLAPSAVTTGPRGVEKPAEPGFLSNPIVWVVAGVVAVAGTALVIVALGSSSKPYGGTSGVVLHLTPGPDL